MRGAGPLARSSDLDKNEYGCSSSWSTNAMLCCTAFTKKQEAVKGRLDIVRLGGTEGKGHLAGRGHLEQGKNRIARGLPFEERGESRTF